MADFKAAKVVGALPATLEADTVYFVRRAGGFDIKLTNGVGAIVAYNLNLNTPAINPLGPQTYTVADRGGDFPTIGAAIDEALVSGSSAVTIEIAEGYIVREQLHYEDVDLSRITLVAENNATIMIDRNYLTAEDAQERQSFIGLGRCSGFTVKAQFSMQTPGDALTRAGISLRASTIHVSGGGVKYAGSYGIFAAVGSSAIIAEHCDFSHSGYDGVAAIDGATVYIGNYNNFSNAARVGATAYRGGQINIGAYNNFSNPLQDAIGASSGSNIVVGAGNNLSNAARFGILVNSGSLGTIGNDNNITGAGNAGLGVMSGSHAVVGLANNLRTTKSGAVSTKISDNGTAAIAGSTLK